MSTIDLFPDSRLKSPIGVKRLVTKIGSLNWVPIFCANCGVSGGMVPEENMTFAFYLCDPCAEKWQPLANTLVVPMEVYWQKVNEAQIEKYGRILPMHEQAELVKDGNSILGKLARERKLT